MRYFITALILLLLGFIGAAAFLLGWFPAALVKSSPSSGARAHVIWARAANRIAAATLTYYQNALATSSSTLSITTEITREARQKALDVLIDQALISDAAHEINTDAEITALVEEKITQHAENQEFGIAVSLIYGLDASGFYIFIAEPEAKKELLMKKKGWDEKALEQWLLNERQKATIVKFVK